MPSVKVLPQFLDRLVASVPADVQNLFVFLGCVDRHRHVVVRGYNLGRGKQTSTCVTGELWKASTHLLEILAETTLQQLCVLVKQRQEESVEHRDRIPPSLQARVSHGYRQGFAAHSPPSSV